MTARKKVAVLGGGCGGMTAAYHLSSTPELREQIEVTVYQLGWRLGGKGASGRDAQHSDRILEHGLHVWGGFYENAFHMMQECYGQLDRPAGAPLRTWRDAFTPRELVVWEERLGERWVHWPVPAPTNTGVPGQGGEMPSVWEYVQMAVGWVRDAVEAFPHEAVRASACRPEHLPRWAWLEEAAHRVESAFEVAFDGSPLGLLRLAEGQARSLAAAPEGHRAVAHHDLLGLLTGAHDWLMRALGEVIRDHDESRRLFVLLDLTLAMVRGLIRDGVVLHGFMAIDDSDLADWLRQHGASSLALESAPLRGYYDYFFAYENGDTTRPRMSAGMGVYHLLRLVATYKGSLFWKMESGMGDAVFGPLYELCRRNGVRFRFFHEVRHLGLSADGRRVETMEIARQVDLKGPEYEPLVDVLGLPSWPAAPLLDQIVDEQAAELRRRGADLEDPWTDWDPAEVVRLQAGNDFDAVVLGISIGSFPTICKELLERNADWRAMVEALQTIQTQALQLWWRPTAAELGWRMGNATGTGYGQLLESWSDMTPVIVRERWAPGQAPGMVVYFCGPMQNPPAMPEGRDPAFGSGQTRAARQNALEWCERYLHHLFPGAGGAGTVDWSLLADPAGGTGRERFDAQYVRANYTPSERYVLDLPGTNRHRLEADTSGYENLALAGDWVFTGLGGAVESAVIAGMQAARALTGRPLPIVGEVRSPWPRPRSVRALLAQPERSHRKEAE